MKQNNKRKDKMYYAENGKNNKELIRWFATDSDWEAKYEWVRDKILDGEIPRRNTPHLLSKSQLDRKNYPHINVYIMCLHANMNYNNIVARVLGESQVSHKSGIKRVKNNITSIEDEQLEFNEQIEEIN